MPALPYTYSFKDTNVNITGVGGNLVLSDGGVSNEGIKISMVEDKNNMTTGADGNVMHSLIAHDAGEVSIMLLKTSPLNAALDNMYNAQKTSSAAWGSNTISVNNPTSGDSLTISNAAFKRRPTITYAKEGGTMEWVLDCGKINGTIGGGIIGNIATFGASFV